MNKTIAFKQSRKRSAAKICLTFFIALLCGVLPAAQTFACEENAVCIEENSWQLGIAIGVGGRTNPLIDGDPVPFVVLPDIAYYGKSFYFDNGELGWQIMPSSSTSFEVFLAPNFEKANFSFWHTANILIPSASLGAASPPGEPGEVPDSYELSVDDIASRKWAIDAGLRWQWYTRNHQLRVLVATDASGTHKGQHALVEYQYSASFRNWQLGITPHLKWQSDKLTDYYYGVSERDTDIDTLLYQGKGGLQYGVSLHTIYALNTDWHWLMRLSATRLHSGMTDSPLVEDSTTYSAFAGFAYRF